MPESLDFCNGKRIPISCGSSLFWNSDGVSKAMLSQIACPSCDALSTSDNSYCGNCGTALTASNRYRDYERAVGSAILALNGVESEIFYLLDILGAATPSLEGAYFT